MVLYQNESFRKRPLIGQGQFFHLGRCESISFTVGVAAAVDVVAGGGVVVVAVAVVGKRRRKGLI